MLRVLKLLTYLESAYMTSHIWVNIVFFAISVTSIVALSTNQSWKKKPKVSIKTLLTWPCSFFFFSIVSHSAQCLNEYCCRHSLALSR